MKGMRRAAEALLRSNFLQRHGQRSLETAGGLGVEGDWRTEVRAFSLEEALSRALSPHRYFRCFAPTQIILGILHTRAHVRAHAHKYPQLESSWI